MRTIFGAAFLLFVLAGCATMGPRGGCVSDQDLNGSATTEAPPSVEPPDLGPHIVQPVTGGAPEIAIPLGGNIYQPVTGGPPVIGIPLN